MGRKLPKKFDSLSEEEQDEYFRPMKSNNRKSLAPLFIKDIIQTKSSKKKHLTHVQIMNILRDDYDVILERKAVGRHIHALVDEGIYGICSGPADGVWYDPDSPDLWYAA